MLVLITFPFSLRKVKRGLMTFLKWIGNFNLVMIPAGVGMDYAILPSIISKRGNISLTNSKMKLGIHTKKFKNGCKKLIPA